MLYYIALLPVSSVSLFCLTRESSKKSLNPRIAIVYSYLKAFWNVLVICNTYWATFSSTSTCTNFIPLSFTRF